MSEPPLVQVYEMQETISTMERNNQVLKDINLTITDKLINLERTYDEKINAKLMDLE
jgi:hypothetical protein